jgi:hypothetical protein
MIGVMALEGWVAGISFLSIGQVRVGLYWTCAGTINCIAYFLK